MEYLKFINLASNIVLSGAIGAFTIFLFGRENSMVYKLKTHSTIALKMGVSMCAAGALYNALTLSDPPPSEVILNSGLAIVSGWAAWFHYNQFVKEPIAKPKAFKMSRKRKVK